MLRIRRRQMEQLDAIALARFGDHASSEAARWSEAPLEALTPEQRSDWIDERVRRAMDLGLEDARAILAWLEVAAHWGDAFAERAFVVHELMDADAVADWERTRALIAAMADAEYAEAEDAT